MNEKESLAGRVLSHYELVEEIGRGGMGVVYRARDKKLRRDVAIKVLPERLVSDRERVKRFEREALALAKLNHPNVATIHELAEHEGELFLVLELVPGEDLAERLSRGPLSTSEALSLFHQITRALEVAHDQGIVHRDLKPANVRITPDGTVKVLDFGLARPFEVTAPADLSQSPTLTKEGTATGVLVGTPFYMSPEQARGKVVDSRTDVWAFGCVLYEALTGKLAFAGETVSDTIAAILKKEPDWTALPEETPPSIRMLLRRCLRTDPPKRLHHIADARLEIEDAIDGIGIAPVAPERRSTPGWVALAAAGALLVSASVGYFLRGEREEVLRRFSIVAPEGTVLARDERPAISPDGSVLAFVAENDAGERELWIRRLDSASPQAMPGTKGASEPFWSPDSQSIGFFSEGKLRRVDANGGNRRELADVERARGGSWGSRGVISSPPAGARPSTKFPPKEGRSSRSRSSMRRSGLT